jgi:hypothetical protein
MCAPTCCPCSPACCAWFKEEASARTAPRLPLLSLSLCPWPSLSLYCSLCSRHGHAKLQLELGHRHFHCSASLRARPLAPLPPSRSLPCSRALAAAPAQAAAAARTHGQSAASCFGTGGAHPRMLCGSPVPRSSPTPAPVPCSAAVAAVRPCRGLRDQAAVGRLRPRFGHPMVRPGPTKLVSRPSAAAGPSLAESASAPLPCTCSARTLKKKDLAVRTQTVQGSHCKSCDSDK